MSTAALLLAASVFLMGCLGGSLALLRKDKAAQQVRRRRLSVVGRYALEKAAHPPLSSIAILPTTWLLATAHRAIGMNPMRAEPYKHSPWLVLPAAIAPATSAWWMLHGLFGQAAWLALAPCWLVCVRMAYQSDDTKRNAALLKQFPDALATIVRAVQVGIPVADSIRIVAHDSAEPTASEFGRIYDHVSIGKPLDEALQELSSRSQVPEYRFFATALSLQSQTGGSLTDTLENLADVIRKRVALKARGYALAAEAADERGGAGGVAGAVRGRAGGVQSCLHQAIVRARRRADDVLRRRHVARVGPARHAPAYPQEPGVNEALLLGGLASLMASVGALLVLHQLGQQDRLKARLASVQPSYQAKAGGRAEPMGFLKLLGVGGTALARSGLLSTATLQQLEQTLHSAGLRGAGGLGVFIGAKFFLMASLPLAMWLGLHSASLQPFARNGAVVASAIIGLLLPDYVVRRRRANFIRRLQAGLADALDMLVICTEAGLGLEPAFTRVAREIGQAHPAVADEMTHTANELRLASDRREAILNMGRRTGLESLKRLGATLIQSQQYGTPLSQTLRVLSVEMRGEMLVKYEGNAARLPVLLTVPMIVFILPTVFVIVGGPAMLSALKSFYP